MHIFFLLCSFYGIIWNVHFFFKLCTTEVAQCLYAHSLISKEIFNFYTSSNFEIRRDVSHNRLHTSPRVTIKCILLWFLLLQVHSIHAFYDNSPQTRNDITSNLEVGQGVSDACNASWNYTESNSAHSVSQSKNAVCAF